MIDPLINIPREYTAIAEWLFSTLFIIFSHKKLKGWKLSLVILGFLPVFIGYQFLAGILPIIFWIPTMVGSALLIWLYIYVLTEMNVYAVGFYGIQAFIMAEFVASFEWQIYYYFAQNLGDILIISILFVFLIYGSVFLMTYLLEHRYKKTMREFLVQKNDFLTAFGIGLSIFIISNLSFTGINSPFTGRYVAEIFYIRTLVDLLGVILLYSHREHKRYLYAQMELSATQNLLDKHYQQYQMSQESYAMVNQKYHDLKHQIVLIRNETDFSKKEHYLEEMEKGIKTYESQYKTGYSVFDTILTSKAIACLENNITLNAVANGELLEFINVMDLVSLFGNAMDNAIESSKLIDKHDKRLINLSVHAQKGMILIRVENYYENKLNYDNGILVTTKNDRFTHGYGLKSIKIITEKYGGSVKISTKGNWFRLIILIPIDSQ